MKNIDFKSLLIGILITTILFLTMGANSTKTNLGDIKVKSITIVNDNNKMVGFLGSTKHSSVLMLMNPLSENTVTIINSETEAGIRIIQKKEDGGLSQSVRLGIFQYLNNNSALLFSNVDENNLIHIGVFENEPQMILNDLNGYPSLSLHNDGMSLFNEDGALVVHNGLQKNGDGSIVIMDSTGHSHKWMK